MGERFVLHDLVSRCCHKLTLPADRVWEMSLPDIVLSLRPAPDQEDLTRLFDAGRRQELLAGMTLEQRVAFEQLKSDLM